MKKTIRPELQRAMEAYWDAKEANGGSLSREIKMPLLKDIEKASIGTRHNGIRGFTAWSGTFFFRWQDGKFTRHSETHRDGYRDDDGTLQEFAHGTPF